MDDLVIRFGSEEGPRNPTATDIRRALEDIESGANPRPELSIENVGNWRSEIVDGKRVVHCVLEGRYVTAATFGLEDPDRTLGWTVFFHESDNDPCFALALPGARASDFIEGWACGGPLTIRKGCVVLLAVAHDALTYFAQFRERSPAHEWLTEREFSNFFEGR